MTSSNLGLIDSVSLVDIHLVLCVKQSVSAPPAKANGPYLIVPFVGVCEEDSALLIYKVVPLRLSSSTERRIDNV